MKKKPKEAHTVLQKTFKKWTKKILFTNTVESRLFGPRIKKTRTGKKFNVRIRLGKKAKYTTSVFFPLMEKQISVREKQEKSGLPFFYVLCEQFTAGLPGLEKFP